MTPARPRRLAAALALAGALAGCAGTRPYQASSDGNVRFTTEVESGSWLSSVRASVHVHSVGRDCRTAYEGTIPLERPAIVTGLPPGRPSYLVLAFDSASFLTNSRGSIHYETMLTPRRGHDYEVAVSYLDDTYNATVREVNRRSRARREIPKTPLAACRARG